MFLFASVHPRLRPLLEVLHQLHQIRPRKAGRGRQVLVGGEYASGVAPAGYVTAPSAGLRSSRKRFSMAIHWCNTRWYRFSRHLLAAAAAYSTFCATFRFAFRLQRLRLLPQHPAPLQRPMDHLLLRDLDEAHRYLAKDDTEPTRRDSGCFVLICGHFPCLFNELRRIWLSLLFKNRESGYRTGMWGVVS